VVWYGELAEEEITDVQVEEWQPWEVLTNRFTNINFSDVKKICIGFGTRGWPMAAGGGAVYFDEINLYPPTCRPDVNPLEGDFSENCIIDWADVEMMAGDWLIGDVNLGPVQEPCDVNLVGWWKFDEPGSSIVTDYAGYDNNGVIETMDVNVWWTAGHDGNALDFEGGTVRVPDAAQLKPLRQVSVSAWIKYSEEQDETARVLAKGADNKETYVLKVDEDDELRFAVYDGNDYDPCDDEYAEYQADSGEDALERNEWIHVAGTYDGNTVKCYINGEVVGTNDDANAIGFLSQDTNDLFIGNYDQGGRPFEGIIDDVRVYNYGLSLEEVRYLATDGTGILTLQSVYNLYNLETLGDRAINFRDFAELAKKWLDIKLWPE
jgi:hypothetical protein